MTHLLLKPLSALTAPTAQLLKDKGQGCRKRWDSHRNSHLQESDLHSTSLQLKAEATAQPQPSVEEQTSQQALGVLINPSGIH